MCVCSPLSALSPHHLLLYPAKMVGLVMSLASSFSKGVFPATVACSGVQALGVSLWGVILIVREAI